MTDTNTAAPDTRIGYDEDYALWLNQQVRLLERGDLAALDRANLADEVADMARSQRDAVISNMIVVIKHLLKCLVQPERISGSWLGSIREHRRRLAKDFKDSPSLRRHARLEFPEAYDDALKQAADETRLPRTRFPVEPPFTIEDVFDSEWFPPEIADHLYDRP